MQNKPEKIILRDSEEAASIKTVTGWVSAKGHFYGDNEDLARYNGATHQRCPNNPDHHIYRINGYCDICHKESRRKKFAEMPRQTWDRETPLVIFDTDIYFFEEDQIADYCSEFVISPDALQLMICEPNYAHSLDPRDVYCDLTPEDGEVPNELSEAFHTLNQAIKTCPPISWSEGKFAAALPAETLERIKEATIID